MTERFEERVRAALVAGVGDADAVGLADGARSRLRSRRRTTATVGSVVVAVAAVPVVLALTLSGDTTDRSPVTPPATSDSPSPSPDRDPVSDGRRVESWRNLTLQVPDDWGYGGGTDWCAADGSGSRPEVVRPEAGVRSIGCTPQLSYGLHFGDGSAINWRGPPVTCGSTAGTRLTRSRSIPRTPGSGSTWSATTTRWSSHRTRRRRARSSTRLLASTVAIRTAARRGTWLTPQPAAATGGVCAATGATAGWCRASCCRSPIRSPSRTRRGGTAEGPGRPHLRTVRSAHGFVRVGSGEDLGTMSIVFENDCADHNGIFLSGTARELTSDVLYWGLSPGWSGGWTAASRCPSSSVDAPRTCRASRELPGDACPWKFRFPRICGETAALRPSAQTRARSRHAGHGFAGSAVPLLDLALFRRCAGPRFAQAQRSDAGTKSRVRSPV